MEHTMRKPIVLGLLAGFAALAALTAVPADAKVPGPNGRIAFTRIDPAMGGTVTYMANPDGSKVEQLFTRGQSEFPHWSPDGSEVSIFCCDDGMAAHIVDPDTGSFRELAPPDPTLETHCGQWAPDGQRLACESFGVTDPSRNGIYSIRSSDGGGLARITSNPGGDDIPGDYSPDGKRLVFVRSDENGPVGIFVTRLNGSGLQQITPTGMNVGGFFGGSWSPSGNTILFTARTTPDHRLAIWAVHADGSGLHQLPIAPACGGAFSDPRSVSCFEPGWSPDGTKIVFTRISANGTQENIYTVNADGSGLVQVTRSSDDSQPDWGPHPLIP
jgi:Tol biopolymer transport system component